MNLFKKRFVTGITNSMCLVPHQQVITNKHPKYFTVPKELSEDMFLCMLGVKLNHSFESRIY